MSASWDALDAVPAEPCSCPMCLTDEFGSDAPDRWAESEPWWLACGISTAGAVTICALMFAAFVVAVLASGVGH